MPQIRYFVLTFGLVALGNITLRHDTFNVVLFIMLYKVVLTFKSVDETVVCDHSNESYQAVLSCVTIQMKAIELLSRKCLLCCTRWL